MSKLCPACGHLLFLDMSNMRATCFCGYTDEVGKPQITHPVLPKDFAAVGKCFIPPRSILVATYGTLKRGRPYELPAERGTFIGIDHIPNGQIHVNKEMRIWPIIVPGTRSIDCDLYLVDGKDFNWLKTGEEANGYKTVLTKLQSGQEAYVWWYDVVQLGTAWEPVDKY